MLTLFLSPCSCGAEAVSAVGNDGEVDKTLLFFVRLVVVTVAAVAQRRAAVGCGTYVQLVFRTNKRYFDENCSILWYHGVFE
jgi:hypothetical protein